jgi:hypothetical protein
MGVRGVRFEVVAFLSVKSVAFRPNVETARFCEPMMHATILYALEANNVYVLKNFKSSKNICF